MCFYDKIPYTKFEKCLYTDICIISSNYNNVNRNNEDLTHHMVKMKRLIL